VLKFVAGIVGLIDFVFHGKSVTFLLSKPRLF
jgi:hypothetical protein